MRPAYFRNLSCFPGHLQLTKSRTTVKGGSDTTCFKYFERQASWLKEQEPERRELTIRLILYSSTSRTTTMAFMSSSDVLQLPDSQPGLLLLPPSIRLRIYELVGACSLDSDDYQTFDLNGHGQCPSSTSLLLSCRTIYDELSRQLYSSNFFIVRYSAGPPPEAPDAIKGLQRLKSLRPGTVRALRHIKIVLDEASCHYRSEDRDGGPWEYWKCCIDPEDIHSHQIEWCARTHYHDEPLAALDSRTRACLAEWDAAAAYLAPLLAEDALDLALVCDIGLGPDQARIAGSVVQSLLRLPKLKNCSVRLCKEPDSYLAQVAYEAVQRARWIMNMGPQSALSEFSDCKARSLLESDTAKTGSTHPDGGAGLNVMTASTQPAQPSPPYLILLPKELRLRILEYTDLISPWMEVTWSRQHAAFVAGKAPCVTLDFRGEICPPARHHGCQFRECWNNTYPAMPSAPLAGCFCRVLHSAYSSTTSACRCWAPPQALFLVCWQLCHDARMVFFAGNRFVVHDLCANPPYQREAPGMDDGYFAPRLAASVFLQEVVPVDCLGYLRFMEIVFPPYWPDVWPSEDHPALVDWVATLDWAANKLNLPGLTIRMVMADPWNHEAPRRGVTAAQGEAMLEGQRRILRPMSRLRELARFYALCSWPLKRNDEWQGKTNIIKEKEHALKKVAEHLVMGDRYGSLNDTCNEPSRSLWQYRFYEDDDDAS